MCSGIAVAASWHGKIERNIRFLKLGKIRVKKIRGNRLEDEEINLDE